MFTFGVGWSGGERGRVFGVRGVGPGWVVWWGAAWLVRGCGAGRRGGCRWGRGRLVGRLWSGRAVGGRGGEFVEWLAASAPALVGAACVVGLAGGVGVVGAEVAGDQGGGGEERDRREAGEAAVAAGEVGGGGVFDAGVGAFGGGAALVAVAVRG